MADPTGRWRGAGWAVAPIHLRWGIQAQIGPVGGIADKAVADGVVAAIVHRFGHGIGRAQRMFPEPPLPDARLALCHKAGAKAGGARLAQGMAEAAFQPLPAFREMHGPLGLGQHGMQVVGQDDDGMQGGGIIAEGGGSSGAQQADPVGQQGTAPVLKAEGEGIGPTGDAQAAIIGHRLGLGHAGQGFLSAGWAGLPDLRSPRQRSEQ